MERSRFRATREGHHVQSRAFRTEVLDRDVEDGPECTASYLIEVPNGGAVLLRGNRLSKGPRSGNRSTAISIGAEGVDRPTPEIRIESNVFALSGSYRTLFVTNHTATPALLGGETVCRPLSSLCAAMDGSRPNQERSAEWSWEHPLEWCSVMSTSQAFNQGNSNAPARLCLRPIPEAMQCSTVRLPARESSSLVMPSRGAAE